MAQFDYNVYQIINPNPYGTTTGDKFGYSAAFSDNYIAISAPGERSDTGVANVGAVYVYDKNTFNDQLFEGGDSVSEPMLSFTNRYDSTNQQSTLFGHQIKINNEKLFISEPHISNAGEAYGGRINIYTIPSGGDGGTINDPNIYDTPFQDQFGLSMDINDNYLISSSHTENEGAGVVYIFDINTNARLWDIQEAGSTGFGKRVAISDNYFLSAAEDGMIRWYNLSDRTLKHSVDLTGETLLDADMSNEYVIVSTQESGVNIYDIETGALFRNITSLNEQNPAGIFGSVVKIQDDFIGVFLEHEFDGSIVESYYYNFITEKIHGHYTKYSISLDGDRILLGIRSCEYLASANQEHLPIITPLTNFEVGYLNITASESYIHVSSSTLDAVMLYKNGNIAGEDGLQYDDPVVITDSYRLIEERYSMSQCNRIIDDSTNITFEYPGLRIGSYSNVRYGISTIDYDNILYKIVNYEDSGGKTHQLIDLDSYAILYEGTVPDHYGTGFNKWPIGEIAVNSQYYAIFHNQSNWDETKAGLLHIYNKTDHTLVYTYECPTKTMISASSSRALVMSETHIYIRGNPGFLINLSTFETITFTSDNEKYLYPAVLVGQYLVFTSIMDINTFLFYKVDTGILHHTYFTPLREFSREASPRDYNRFYGYSPNNNFIYGTRFYDPDSNAIYILNLDFIDNIGPPPPGDVEIEASVDIQSQATATISISQVGGENIYVESNINSLSAIIASTSLILDPGSSAPSCIPSDVITIPDRPVSGSLDADTLDGLDSTDFASSEQGTLAETSLQENDIIEGGSY